MHTLNLYTLILEQMEFKDFVLVLICGPADTGKTTMANQICEMLKSRGVGCEVIGTDSFLIDRFDRINKGISGYNIESLKEKELSEFVQDIEGRKEVRNFSYDSSKGANSSNFKIIKEIGVLIIEGIHSFNELIRHKADLKIFIDASDEILRQLRFEANINKRSFSIADAGQRIEIEMEEYYHFIEPLKKCSDLILNVDSKYNYS